jgi:hypothetical protein
MASAKDHLIVLKMGTKDHYECKCGWVGDLKGVCEHMAKNQPDLTRVANS